MEIFNKNWISLSSEKLNVVRDEHGVPIEWTLLKVGDNPLCQEGIDGNLHLSSENMSDILEYFDKKGELIPIDIPNCKLEVSDEVIAERRAKFVPNHLSSPVVIWQSTRHLQRVRIPAEY